MPFTNGCPVCADRQQAGTTEVYLLNEGEDSYLFNVDKAKAIVSDGRNPVAIAEATVQKIVAVNNYCPSHLAHVNCGNPGIIIKRFGGLVLLDGIHRAVQSLSEGRDFYAYLLTYRESLACLIRQEIASRDASAIVAKLRKVMATVPDTAHVEAELECTPVVLAQVRSMLTPEEKRRFGLRIVRLKKSGR